MTTIHQRLSIVTTLCIAVLSACSTTSPSFLCSGRLQPINPRMASLASAPTTLASKP